ncbi:MULTISPECIES: VOC family protein [Halomonadaceae]|uniref:VOC family protein n=1 Tax=Billgrantia aerodenitrificans TaxID=2733483 RepID=A0ABS9AMC5_9GAMM|nr:MULTISPECIES: VOC family protein [Halomonas]MCE8022905.1 VOC family protein [Halomonas aerodenitrificans]MCE8037636.1 VOC family protein [Halomonas sp. MCCC 1A11062]
MQLSTYLIFDGNCREAFEFYQRCFDAKLEAVSTYGEMPASEGMEIPEEARDLIMHARLRIGDQLLMASDNSPGCPAPYEGIKGASIAVGVDSVEQAEKLFNALADNGNVQMPLEETFWAHRFGMLVDKFGVAWMINYDKEQQAAA